MIAFATMVAGSRGPVVPALLGLAALVVWGLVLRASMKALLWKGPALVLDAKGVTDLWRKRPTVLWSAIADARVVDNEGDELVLRLREDAAGQPAKIFIDLARLRHDRKTVERTVDAHLSHANQPRMPTRGA
ncbi:MAG TPA: hypothetical protein VLA61_00605 [Ideonella sp.]|uniref:hypothetical protein n=1 Tax=Ideonella sp. TaxID=1929293 RepID=UPI002C894260|nr:hypothetical protein [Ideonella sp.]HSI46750.1 hypothetical protein [Ideonella sp.]